MPEWTPQIAVGEPQARSLLGSQFPELDVHSLLLLGEGWDNTAWLVDERWVFRFPRRAIALPGIEREIAVLPRLAPLLTLAVPSPVFVGRPDEGYPWPFFGAPFVPGVELAEAGMNDAQRVGIARQLGEFLRALHSAEIDVELPFDPISRSDMTVRVPRTRERLAELGDVPDGAEDILEAALALPPPEKETLVHGDLHLRHVLVEGGQLSGVIDWGDVCRADPAVDLALVWCALPADARREFFAVYGDVSEAALLRARVLSLFLCAVLALHARQEGLPQVERESLAGLDRTLR